MLYQQIPVLLYSLTPKFNEHQSVKLTHSQYNLLENLLGEYCHTHDVPRLKGLVKRIHRRMHEHTEHHLWHTEFDFISNHLMNAMKESGYCREEDDVQTAIDILHREKIEELKTARSGMNQRHDDESGLFSDMKRFLVG
ncbi:hypothetical protein [Pleionea sp. CnH1-48]|uniref:hypothetical protein n=1 Tax=Pleionea sp. CnH1-48 TaxID=2954494 RepID=UPI0020984FF4|nr:hypothetical protein [Pleionea sp. CnH1-48]MCO7223565.1 hypothetical protein [Pleionea sp. CnH1-48]